MIWHGDIFVVKKDANGDDLMDMVTEDIEDVVELLKESVAIHFYVAYSGSSNICQHRAVLSSRIY